MTCRALQGVNASENGMWCRTVPQMAMSGAAPIRHALCAIGSLHRHTIQEALRLQHYFLDVSTTQYNLALSTAAFQTQGESTSLNTTMICCLLFIVYESFRGRKSHVRMHVKHGFELLRYTLRQQHLATPLYPGDTSVHSRELVYSNHFQAVFFRFVRQLKELGIYLPDTCSSIIGDAPSLIAFTSIDQASRAFEHIYLLSVQRVETNARQTDLDQAKHAAPEEITQAIKTWCMAMDAFTWGLRPKQAIHMARPGLLNLMVYRIACTIALGIPPNASEMSYDSFLAEFEDMVTMCEEIIGAEDGVNPKPTSSFITFAVSPCPISPLLYLICWRCRDPNIRRKALKLLSTMNTRDGLWDSNFLACVAEEIIRGEERKAITSSGNRTKESFQLQQASDIPNGARLKDGMPLSDFTSHPVTNDLVYHYQHIMNKCGIGGTV